MNYTVVIPSNNTDRLLRCVAAIGEHEPELPAHRILIVDDGIDWARFKRDWPWSWNIAARAGKKPFCFARNMNIGLDVCKKRGHDAILLNDDALLETPGGFKILADLMADPDYKHLGILSPTFDSVGNPKQRYRGHPANVILGEYRMLCFICVYVRFEVFAGDGEHTAVRFDERFVDYGMDDDDFSKEAIAAGWKLAVHDSVRVNHTTLSSAYRGTGAGDFRANMRRFIEKWGVDNWGKDREHSQFADCFPTIAAAEGVDSK